MLAAIDLTTIEVWTRSGLITYYLLFVMELKTRRVHFAECTVNPNERWMKQIARNLTDTVDGFLNGKRYLIMDRDTKFCHSFREILEHEDVKPSRLPPRSPNLNANLERYFRGLKDECLSRIIFFGEKSLRRAIISYLQHFHQRGIIKGLATKPLNRVVKLETFQARSSAANGSVGCFITTTALRRNRWVAEMRLLYRS